MSRLMLFRTSAPNLTKCLPRTQVQLSIAWCCRMGAWVRCALLPMLLIPEICRAGKAPAGTPFSPIFVITSLPKPALFATNSRLLKL